MSKERGAVRPSDSAHCRRREGAGGDPSSRFSHLRPPDFEALAAALHHKKQEAKQEHKPSYQRPAGGAPSADPAFAAYGRHSVSSADMAGHQRVEAPLNLSSLPDRQGSRSGMSHTQPYAHSSSSTSSVGAHSGVASSATAASIASVAASAAASALLSSWSPWSGVAGRQATASEWMSTGSSPSSSSTGLPSTMPFSPGPLSPLGPLHPAPYSVSPKHLGHPGEPGLVPSSPSTSTAGLSPVGPKAEKGGSDTVPMSKKKNPSIPVGIAVGRQRQESGLSQAAGRTGSRGTADAPETRSADREKRDTAHTASRPMVPMLHPFPPYGLAAFQQSGLAAPLSPFAAAPASPLFPSPYDYFPMSPYFAAAAANRPDLTTPDILSGSGYPPFYAYHPGAAAAAAAFLSPTSPSPHTPSSAKTPQPSDMTRVLPSSPKGSEALSKSKSAADGLSRRPSLPSSSLAESGPFQSKTSRKRHKSRPTAHQTPAKEPKMAGAVGSSNVDRMGPPCFSPSASASPAVHLKAPASESVTAKQGNPSSATNESPVAANSNGKTVEEELINVDDVGGEDGCVADGCVADDCTDSEVVSTTSPPLSASSIFTSDQPVVESRHSPVLSVSSAFSKEDPLLPTVKAGLNAADIKRESNEEERAKSPPFPLFQSKLEIATGLPLAARNGKCAAQVKPETIVPDHAATAAVSSSACSEPRICIKYDCHKYPVSTDYTFVNQLEAAIDQRMKTITKSRADLKRKLALLESEVARESAISEGLSQSSKSASASQPGKSVSVSQPGKSASVSQPGKSASVSRPGKSASTSQPGKSASTSQPSESLQHKLAGLRLPHAVLSNNHPMAKSNQKSSSFDRPSLRPTPPAALKPPNTSCSGGSSSASEQKNKALLRIHRPEPSGSKKRARKETQMASRLRQLKAMKKRMTEGANLRVRKRPSSAATPAAPTGSQPSPHQSPYTSKAARESKMELSESEQTDTDTEESSSTDSESDGVSRESSSAASLGRESDSSEFSPAENMGSPDDSSAFMCSPLTEADLRFKDTLALLLFRESVFMEASAKVLVPDNAYSVWVKGATRRERHTEVMTQADLLRTGYRDQGPVKEAGALRAGMRVAVYWSDMFTCMYVASVRSTLSLKDGSWAADVECDDGDRGVIPLVRVRLIPGDFPETCCGESSIMHAFRKPAATACTPLAVATGGPALASPAGSVSSFSPSALKSSLSSASLKRQQSAAAAAVEKKGKPLLSPTGSAATKKQPHPATQKGLRSGSVSGSRDHKKADQTHVVTLSSDSADADEDEMTFDMSHPGLQPAGPSEAWKPVKDTKDSAGRKSAKGKKGGYDKIVKGAKCVEVGDCAVFHPGPGQKPYVGKVAAIYQDKRKGLVLQVYWYYHPSEVSIKENYAFEKGALLQSDHQDTISVKSLWHKCSVESRPRFRLKKANHQTAAFGTAVGLHIFYLAGLYDCVKNRLTEFYE